jgi:competence protein ComEC
MKNYKKYLPYIALGGLLIVTCIVFYFLYFKNQHTNLLKVAFLDIGQGDSIYIEAPNGKQMLIDGGPNSVVLSRLSKVMPFADRSIDIVLATHDDSDHIGGLPSVLSNYKVGYVVENGATSNTSTYKDLESKITKGGVKKLIARRGMKFVLDQEKNIYFQVLFPDRDVQEMDSNDGSIVGKLVYGNESFMLTGDATKYTELLIKHNEDPTTLHSQVLKLGHHGSHTSSSELWLEVVAPDVAVISAGLHNRYGHPHQDVLDRLKNLNIPYWATYKQGTIIFKTDGLTLSH